MPLSRLRRMVSLTSPTAPCFATAADLGNVRDELADDLNSARSTLASVEDRLRVQIESSASSAARALAAEAAALRQEQLIVLKQHSDHFEAQARRVFDTSLDAMLDARLDVRVAARHDERLEAELDKILGGALDAAKAVASAAAASAQSEMQRDISSLRDELQRQADSRLQLDRTVEEVAALRRDVQGLTASSVADVKGLRAELESEIEARRMGFEATGAKASELAEALKAAADAGALALANARSELRSEFTLDLAEATMDYRKVADLNASELASASAKCQRDLEMVAADGRRAIQEAQSGASEALAAAVHALRADLLAEIGAVGSECAGQARDQREEIEQLLRKTFAEHAVDVRRELRELRAAKDKEVEEAAAHREEMAARLRQELASNIDASSETMKRAMGVLKAECDSRLASECEAVEARAREARWKAIKELESKLRSILTDIDRRQSDVEKQFALVQVMSGHRLARQCREPTIRCGSPPTSGASGRERIYS